MDLLERLNEKTDEEIANAIKSALDESGISYVEKPGEIDLSYLYPHFEQV